MKKFSKYFVAAAIVVATTAAVLVGCKKEKDEPKDNGRQSEAAVLVNRINKFFELRDATNSGAKADGSMTVEEMREILCMVSNYEHSEHEIFCHNTVLDTLEVRMVPIANGNVLESDVVAVYNAFETELENCMESVDDGMDVPSLFSIVLPENGTRDEEDIKIIFTRGQKAEPESISSPLVSGPFHDICWYWGLDLGRCDGGLSALVDAADVLSTYFTPNVNPPGNGYIQIFGNVEYVEYIATNRFSVVNPNFQNYTYWVPAEQITPCTYWLFNQYGPLAEGEEEPCLCEDEMNCEWFNINEHIVEPTGALHYSPNYHSPYYSCEVLDKYLINKDKVMCDRHHTALVCYATYFWENPTIVE